METTNKLKLRAELLRDEGLRLKPYRCTAGKLSIGVGRNLDDIGITRAEAEFLLLSDIDRAMVQLDKALPWWRSLDAVRQRVIVNMVFNLGMRGLLKFKNTLAALKAGNYEGAAKGMLASVWAGQVKGRATRLAEMMRTGIDPLADFGDSPSAAP